jgi:hypothetical protein
MRAGELRHLRWSATDLEGRVARVGRSKTAAGEGRPIPLNDRALRVDDLGQRIPRPETGSSRSWAHCLGCQPIGTVMLPFDVAPAELRVVAVQQPQLWDERGFELAVVEHPNDSAL